MVADVSADGERGGFGMGGGRIEEGVGGEGCGHGVCAGYAAHSVR